jgi:hypothetical protein
MIAARSPYVLLLPGHRRLFLRLDTALKLKAQGPCTDVRWVGVEGT